MASDGWLGWKDEICAEAFIDIDAWLADDGKQIVLETLCRTIARHPFNLGGESLNVYSKLMRAQNDGALKKKELFSLVKWAFGPSRAITVLKNTSMMIALGHPCPRPLLAVRRKVKSGHHLNLLVTAEVKAPTLESIIVGNGGDEARSAVMAAGHDLAKLHADSFLHGDYLPRNTCLEDGRVVFLDNDKTSRWPFMPPFPLRRRNLEQFAYNLMLLKGLEECKIELPTLFLDAYFEAAKRGDAEKQKALVLRKGRARWENRRRRSL
ncbi:MAG: hypothetical protein IJS15_07455 [Victivallales bacterium]|nr:hypothetical protein [Victivallales bacterium]